jgi:hypothetical protein
MGLVLSLSGGLWLVSQTGVLSFSGVVAWIIWGSFNFFSWQFLFVCGLVLGCLQRAEGMGAWFYSTRTWAVAITWFSFFFLWRHPSLLLGMAPYSVGRDLRLWWFAKPTLGPLRIVDFALFVCLMAQAVKRYGPWLENTLVHRYLRFLGQHSLQVFAWSVLVCYSLHYSYYQFGLLASVGAQTALSLIGVASLYIPAIMHLLYRNRSQGNTSLLRGDRQTLAVAASPNASGPNLEGI